MLARGDNAPRVAAGGSAAAAVGVGALKVLRAAALEPSTVVDFQFDSVDHAVHQYTAHFGPFVHARPTIERQGRWDAFIDAFRELVEHFNLAGDTTARVRADYILIDIHRPLERDGPAAGQA